MLNARLELTPQHPTSWSWHHLVMASSWSWHMCHGAPQRCVLHRDLRRGRPPSSITTNTQARNEPYARDRGRPSSLALTPRPLALNSRVSPSSHRAASDGSWPPLPRVARHASTIGLGRDQTDSLDLGSPYSLDQKVAITPRTSLRYPVAPARHMHLPRGVCRRLRRTSRRGRATPPLRGYCCCRPPTHTPHARSRPGQHTHQIPPFNHQKTSDATSNTKKKRRTIETRR